MSGNDIQEALSRRASTLRFKAGKLMVTYEVADKAIEILSVVSDGMNSEADLVDLAKDALRGILFKDDINDDD